MENGGHIYIAIDLKSFYASAECVDRGLDPLDANLVVADTSRTEKTICLAVSPALKAYGISGRARLFEVISEVERINNGRQRKAPYRRFRGSSCIASELRADPSLKLEYIAAPPRMDLYMTISARIYTIYLRYVAPEDIHVYSVDEVFIDATGYLRTYHCTAREFASMLVHEVLDETGITATAGIGTNLYLCKVAMDVLAKKIPADKDGVRIAELDERKYRETMWEHTPITDFWQVGKGTARKLAEYNMRTMGDVARCSLGGEYDWYSPKLLYKLFGVHAEILIDHAWGWEPCGMKEIKSYRPTNRSLSSGQVLPEPYETDGGRLIVREMTDLLVLDLVEKGMVTDQIVLSIGYDRENTGNERRIEGYTGGYVLDPYGRTIPKPSHGSVRLGEYTSSTKLIMQAVCELYDSIVEDGLLIRRINVAANHIIPMTELKEPENIQLDFFTDFEETERARQRKKAADEREHSLQSALIGIKDRYGKNAVLKGMNLLKGARTIERNGQIGGHRAG
ncbi:MAG: DNA methylase [Ruminococcus sp.]|nr:DNA methylase [Ruminococcus sp.]